MGQWHCAINGKKYGPVDEQILQSWITEGRLKLTDLVWREGMEEWQPASNFPQFSAAVGSVPPTIIPGVQDAGRFVPAPTGGTNGTTKILEITAAAHQSLKGRWGLPIGFCFLLGLLTNAIANVPYIGGVAALFLTGAFAFGYVVFFLTFIRGSQPRLGNMFDGFKIYGTTLAAYLLMLLYTLLWTLLLIIPGLIASLAYSQTFFIIADNPDIRGGQAITRSKEMMRGHKWRLFCMQLWFSLWGFLCIFTLFIGLFWLVPYMHASCAKFYEDLQPPLNQAEAAGLDAVVAT